MRTWNSADGALVHKDQSSKNNNKEHGVSRGYVNSVAFSPDGQIIASGSDDGIVRLQTTSDSVKPRALDANAWSSVTSLAFSRDSHTLAAGYTDGHVRVWDITTGQITLDFPNKAIMSIV